VLKADIMLAECERGISAAFLSSTDVLREDFCESTTYQVTSCLYELTNLKLEANVALSDEMFNQQTVATVLKVQT